MGVQVRDRARQIFGVRGDVLTPACPAGGERGDVPRQRECGDDDRDLDGTPATQREDEQGERKSQEAEPRDVVAEPGRHDVEDRDRDRVRHEDEAQHARSLQSDRAGDPDPAEDERRSCLARGEAERTAEREEPQQHNLGRRGEHEPESRHCASAQRRATRDGDPDQHDAEQDERNGARREHEQGECRHRASGRPARNASSAKSANVTPSAKGYWPVISTPGPDDGEGADRPAGRAIPTPVRGAP